VFEAGKGFAFGELALLYNAPRSATITSIVESEVWSLDRTAFRNLVVRSAEAQFKQYVEFLNGVDVLQVLNDGERAALAEVLEEESFEDDEAIVEQGERDDKMFIVRKGNAVACIKGDHGEVEVMQYSKGDYFGEIALLSGEPRKASVYAVGACTCLHISRQTFMRILGPLQDLLERNMGKYEKYQDAIANAGAQTKEDFQHENERNASVGDEQFDGSTCIPGNRQRRMVNRKRDKQLTALDTTKGHRLTSEAEPCTLAEKVALDLQNPKLVNQSDVFKIPSGHMMAIGFVAAKETFSQHKKLHFQCNIEPLLHEGDLTYLWEAPTKLEKSTEISILCEKGQKSRSDPTPNQDNLFILHIGAVSMYGVCDGHGPFGHLVSFRLVQSLPFFITKSKNVHKTWEEALKDAFLSAQNDLVQFCSSESVNIEASGAAASVLILEEQTVHVATLGDAKIMLGSWNRRDSRMIFCSQDHKPGIPEERARLEAAGSEVREVDPGNFRIYLPGSNFPGLTMSRAFGDTACNGVLREPQYHRFLMQPTDQWYAVIASDGIWEFIDGEEAYSMTAKKLRLKGTRETSNFLTEVSRKRWQHCCGDYSDDITAIMVQWNAPDIKDAAANHSIITKRTE